MPCQLSIMPIEGHNLDTFETVKLRIALFGTDYGYIFADNTNWYCLYFRHAVTMLPDSLYVTDFYFAPVFHRLTLLQHNQSPKTLEVRYKTYWRLP